MFLNPFLDLLLTRFGERQKGKFLGELEPRDSIGSKHLAKSADHFCAELNGIADFPSLYFLDTYLDVSNTFGGSSREHGEGLILDVFDADAQRMTEFFVHQISFVDHFEMIERHYTERSFTET